MKPYFETEAGKLYHGDCLDVMATLPDGSVDAVITDPPYGTTACKWDSVIPFEPMWEQLKRVTKKNGAIVLFGSEPFSSALRMSNIREYKYDWVWDKKLAGNGILAKRQPLKIHELIHVFSSKVYNPQMSKGKMRVKMTGDIKTSEVNGGDGVRGTGEYMSDTYYPKSILQFSLAGLRAGRLHPTQKPVALMEYLIKTYTNEGETVFDFTMGSGTTGVAAHRLGRKFIGIELDEGYCEIAARRMQKETQQLRMFK